MKKSPSPGENHRVTNLALIIFLLSYAISACSHDDLSLIGANSGKYALFLSYEQETVVSLESGSSFNHETGSSLDLRSMPVVTRQKISLGINMDGTSEWNIVETTPKNQVDAPINCPPDKSRTVKTTRITNNTVYHYDTHGGLISSFEVNIPTFIGLVNAINKNDKKFNRSLYNQTFGNNESYMKSSDDHLVEIQPGLLLYSKILDENDSVPPEWIGRKIFNYMESANKTPLAVFVTDPSGNLLHRKIMKYADDPETLLPEYCQEEIYEYRGDSVYVNKVVKKFENVVASVNL